MLFSGPQSAFTETGVNASLSNEVGLVIAVISLFVFIITMAALLFGWFSRKGFGTSIIWGGGIAFPVVVLTGLLIYVTGVNNALARLASPSPPLVIEVTAHQFWWDIAYYNSEGDFLARDANEIHIPRGLPVQFRLTTEDVIHSFWIPSLAGKMDMIPGRVNILHARAEKTGLYRGQCAEFCGLQHPRMALYLKVHEEPEFAAWLDHMKGEARDPDTSFLKKGQDVFLREGCPACHIIKGVAESSAIGPDLTRVGGRVSIGAGMWPSTVGHIAGWIANVQKLKPGAQMPTYDTLSGQELRALSHYLESLK